MKRLDREIERVFFIDNIMTLSMEQLHLSAFDIKASCRKNFNAVLIGKKHTGKSTIIQDILYYLSKTGIPRACVFSATEESNGFFSKFIPGTYIFGIDNVDKRLTSIMDDQKKLLMRQRIGEIDKSIDTRIVIVLDDIGFKKDVLGSQIIRQMFMNGRHDNIILIVTIQHCMLLRPELRANSDYIFVLKQNAVSCIKNLHDHYFGVFPTRKEFSLVLSSCTQNYQCLVLDNTKPTTDIPQICFWYKATPNRRFRVGSREFWSFHEKWFVSDAERYLRERENKGKGGYSSNVVLKNQRK